MQVKRFVAADMRRALELVRQELGPDAIILSSSRTADGIELLTTMGSDSELLQLQQQPLGKIAFANASPMISDDAWSPMVAERDTKNNFSAPAIQSSVQSIHANRGKSGRQLADDIEQARARMLANRKAEESAKEFLVGKNTKVNAGIPRYVGAVKEEPRFTAAARKESRFAETAREESRFTPSTDELRHSAPAKQATRPKESSSAKGTVADRARNATAVNPLRDREEVRPSSAKKDSPAAIADRARNATGANPTRHDIRAMGQEFLQQESAFRVETPAAKKEHIRPPSSQVTIPPRRVAVPRPVLAEKKPAAVAEKAPAVATKPKHLMTAAERYPLIDDEPVEIRQPEFRKPQSKTEFNREARVADASLEISGVESPAAGVPAAGVPAAGVPAAGAPAASAPAARFIITAESDLVPEQVASDSGSNSKIATASLATAEVSVDQQSPVATVTATPDVLELQALHNNKYFLDIQSEIAGMRSLLEQQFNRLQEVTPVLTAATTAIVALEPVLASVKIEAPGADVAGAVQKESASLALTTEAALSTEVVLSKEVTLHKEVALTAEVSLATDLLASEIAVVTEPAATESAIDVSAPIASTATTEVADDVAATISAAAEEVSAIPTLTEELTLELPDVDIEIPTLTSEVNDAELSIMGSQATALAATVKAAEAGVMVEESNEHVLALQSEIADMRFALEQQIQRLTEGDAPMTSSSILGAVSRRLERAGLPEDVVSKVINDCRKTDSLNEAWPEAMAILARQLPVMGRDIVDEGGVFAFVGPTGVGKTTTIGKLAARYVLKHGADKVALITTDTYRIASHEQLRSIARILKVPVKVVDENNSLQSLLKSLSHCAVVLIDTAGFRHGDPQLKTQLATFSGLPQVKTFVVLSTNCQAQMLKASVHAHGEANLQGCVLTKLDETSSLGEALGVVIKGWLPVAYTTDGQDIPKDLDVARGHQLVAKAIAMIKKNPISAVS